MSVLTGKNILIIGDEGHELKNLKNVFGEQGMSISSEICGRTTVADLQNNKIDIVLLNHLHDGDMCANLFSELRGSKVANELPIFVLVENSERRIQQALMLGAADYITVDEPVSSIITKMKLIFGQPDNFSSPSIIEVPSDTPDVTKKGIRVFVVEDDSLLRTLLTVKFETTSFPHEFAVDGTDVLQKMLKFKPQVIILDLMLPFKSGSEILSELKADPVMKSVPVIVFSNQDSQEDKQRVFELGADRFYVKAMTDLSVLIETIEELATT